MKQHRAHWNTARTRLTCAPGRISSPTSKARASPHSVYVRSISITLYLELVPLPDELWEYLEYTLGVCTIS